MGETYKILFMPDHKEFEVSEGISVLQAAGKAGVELDGPCGGQGTCGKCRVRVIKEDGSAQWALACRTIIDRDMTVEIPQLEVSVHRKNELSLGDLNVAVDSGISARVVTVSEPSLKNQHADAERFLGALDNNTLELSTEVLRDLPKTVRAKEAKGMVTAILSGNKILAIEAGDTSQNLYGVAVDIGTTSVVVALMDLNTGETVAIASAGNPQTTFGADVIARIDHVINNEDGLEVLNRRVIKTINRLIEKLAKDIGIMPGEIYQMTMVGNTTMSHLFMKMDPTSLATSPFIPVVSEGLYFEARELNIEIAPHAPVYVTPSIAGYVGGDTIGVIMATEIYKKKGIYLAIDIGTNGELVLSRDGKLASCSTAAGPAFEGAQIKFGMRAADGAIEKVTILEDGEVELGVIGNQPPKGICGSGLMDVVSEMARVGVIESTGRMRTKEDPGDLSPALQKRLGSNEEYGHYFILSFAEDNLGEEVVITNKDIRELQLAKAALAAGVQVLLQHFELTVQDLDGVMLAGAFGSYINKHSALGIGLLPPVDADKINAVGNAAGTGARMELINQEIRQKAQKVARQVEHLELSTRLDFQEYFVDRLSF